LPARNHGTQIYHQHLNNQVLYRLHTAMWRTVCGVKSVEETDPKTTPLFNESGPYDENDPNAAVEKTETESEERNTKRSKVQSKWGNKTTGHTMLNSTETTKPKPKSPLPMWILKDLPRRWQTCPKVIFSHHPYIDHEGLDHNLPEPKPEVHESNVQKEHPQEQGKHQRENLVTDRVMIMQTLDITGHIIEIIVKLSQNPSLIQIQIQIQNLAMTTTALLINHNSEWLKVIRPTNIQYLRSKPSGVMHALLNVTEVVLEVLMVVVHRPWCRHLQRLPAAIGLRAWGAWAVMAAWGALMLEDRVLMWWEKG
jgi:hypothetical protein